MSKSYPQPKRLKYLNNPHKYQGDVSNIIARSSWELKFMRWADNNPSVLKWCSENLVIPYYSKADGKERRYFTDFVVQFRHGDGSVKTFIIEIKPSSQMVAPVKGRKRAATYIKECYDWQVNQDKWEAAVAFARKNGLEFKVLNEYDLGLAKRK